ncbi:NUDIX hydrolase [Salarchaeum sp. JOR-1]|uniref:NUDIX hydrolase n=1 Tax=Salarchaeum sp. JOR-1 TaxID=2599399 RepID=UPI001198732E|nr:NUDIX domain-containing protein [Salarchaeum sp. JOR-1]QDX41455.1 NUDIX domain-containing protein [Salarchaeum sp. JOR-1]
MSEKTWRDIRPVALGVLRRGDETLLARHRDPSDGETFYRPVGGGFEFGEHSRDAVVREFAEELGVEFTVERRLGTLERTFGFDGRRGHEIWRLYAGTTVEEWPYERDEFEAEEPEHGETFPVEWVELGSLDDLTVYPETLAAVL